MVVAAQVSSTTNTKARLAHVEGQLERGGKERKEQHEQKKGERAALIRVGKSSLLSHLMPAPALDDESNAIHRPVLKTSVLRKRIELY